MKKNKRSFRPIDQQNIGAFVNDYLGNLLGNRSKIEIKLLLEWPKIIGNNYARHCYIKKISFPSKKLVNGALHLIIENSAVAVEMQYNQFKIIDKISNFFGYSVISQLIIKQQDNSKKWNDYHNINHINSIDNIYVSKEQKDKITQKVVESWEMGNKDTVSDQYNQKHQINTDELNNILNRLAISIYKKNQLKNQT